MISSFLKTVVVAATVSIQCPTVVTPFATSRPVGRQNGMQACPAFACGGIGFMGSRSRGVASKRGMNGVVPTTALQVSSKEPPASSRNYSGRSSEDDDDDDDEYVDDDAGGGDADWRAFRARLVMQEMDQEGPAVPGNVAVPTLNEMDLPSSGASVAVEEERDEHDGVDRSRNKGEKKDKGKKKRHKIHASSWAYESGDVVEQGSVLLHRPPPPPRDNDDEGGDFGYGLGRQYLHKSVVLILEHDAAAAVAPSSPEGGGPRHPSVGIILNRPTDLILSDQDVVRKEIKDCMEEIGDDPDVDVVEECDYRDYGFFGKIWYGGPCHSIHTEEPKFYCLHSLKSDEALAVSTEVIHGIQFTSVQDARELVGRGVAKPKDFWTFSGFVSWDNDDETAGGEVVSELVDEIHDDVWHTVSTDGRTLRKGLRVLNAGHGVDPREGGIKTWTMLMEMIGQDDDEDDNAAETESRVGGGKMGKKPTFDDLMLREWSAENLVFREAPTFLREDDEEAFSSSPSPIRQSRRNLRAGDVVRAIPSVGYGNRDDGTSPFLLRNQEYHKSLMLITQATDVHTVGVLLNHPSTRTVDVELQDEEGNDHDVAFPVRYGGPMDVMQHDGDDGMPPLFLHRNRELGEAGVGMPFEGYPDDVTNDYQLWRCTMDEALNAVAWGVADPAEFLVAKGLSYWEEEDNSGATAFGVGGEPARKKWRNGDISKECFEHVEPENMDEVWDALLQQRALSKSTLDHNLELSHAAWAVSCEDTNTGGRDGIPSDDDDDDDYEIQDFGCYSGMPMEGRYTSPRQVFNSDTAVSQLSDEALKTWTVAFLLD